ncbi:DinB/UmuC family translesion DNA polymerase [Elizabethkingia anophelis]|uniref:DinB/UmuC family translesion DNA polymerase n=1 Tax=Elizabethkingia anophelis TaxID=1117645 RepID=UPI00136E1B09|nr:hypothetical protein [Elizabethkingia anophelis]
MRRVIDNFVELAERISSFTFKSSETLRTQNSGCHHVTVFLRPTFFKEETDQYSSSITVILPNPTGSAIEISKYATKALKMIFKEGYLYKKIRSSAFIFCSGDEKNCKLI